MLTKWTARIGNFGAFVKKPGFLAKWVMARHAYALHSWALNSIQNVNKKLILQNRGIEFGEAGQVLQIQDWNSVWRAAQYSTLAG